MDDVDDGLELEVPDGVCVTVEVADVDEVTVSEIEGVGDSVGLEDTDWVDDAVGELEGDDELVGVVLKELEGVDDDVKLRVLH